jgi:hypothetical protein
MLKERPWLAAAALVGDTVTLYHGTNTRSWHVACAKGVLAARTDWAEFAATIEAEFGLRPKSVWQHPASSFTRHMRHLDPHVYLTADPAIAESYAAKGSEVIADTLMAAYRLLHPRANPFTPAGKQILNSFVAEWMARHDLAPLVLTLAVPLSALPIPSGSQIQDPAEWWAAVNHFARIPTVVFPGPIPLSWVTSPLPPLSELTL